MVVKFFLSQWASKGFNKGRLGSMGVKITGWGSKRLYGDRAGSFGVVGVHRARLGSMDVVETEWGLIGVV